MSADAIGWVYRHSPYKGARLAVHLAVADSVNDAFGHEFWMRQTRLAKKVRVTRQTVNEGLAAMVTDGLLELLEVGDGGANRYRFLMPDLPVVYENRAPQGVGSGDTRRHRKGATSGDTPVTSADGVGVTSADTEPNGPDPKGSQPLGADAPPEPNAGSIVAGYLDWCDAQQRPRPANIGMVAKNVKALLDAGHAPAAVKHALVTAPTATIPALEMAINHYRPPSSGPRAPISQDRDRPSERLHL